MVGFTLTQVFLIWVVIGGIASFWGKGWITRFIKKHSKLPRILNFYIILTPLVLIEEYLTCETPYFSCIKVTLIVFYIFFLVLYGIQKIFKTRYFASCIIFGLMGWVNEFIFVGRINMLALPQLLIFTVLGIAIYMVVALLPSYYLQEA